MAFLSRGRKVLLAVALLSTTALTLNSNPAFAEEKVSLRLRWLPQASFVGFYVAQAKGFYKKHGLDVTINPGGPNINVETLVGAGTDNFGIGGGVDATLTGREHGAPLVVIGMLLQQSPHVYVAQSKSNIKTLADFKGKTVATWFSGAQYTLYAMLASQHISPSEMTIVPEPASMNAFIDGQFDVATATRYNEFVTLQEAGLKNLSVFKPSDYGVHALADSIVTNEKYLSEHRDTAKAFLQASLEGWAYAFTHRKEAIDIMMSAAPDLKRAHQEATLDEYATLALSGKDGKNGIGEIDMNVVESIQARLLQYKGLKAPIDLNKAFDPSIWNSIPAASRSIGS